MKKLMALILALVLCLSLGACGNPVSKLEGQVAADILNELQRDYNVLGVELGGKKVSNDGEYYFISGEVVIRGMDVSDGKILIFETDFDGMYLRRGGTFAKVYLNIDDDWSFVR